MISAMITDRQIESSLKIKLIADFQTTHLEKKLNETITSVTYRTKQIPNKKNSESTDITYIL